MEAFQSYGVYFIVFGGLLIIAGLIVGYMSTLPTVSTKIDIPPGFSAPEPTPQQSTLDQRTPSSEVPKKEGGVEEANQTPEANPGQAGMTGGLNTDVVNQLERLMKLREQGALTQEQFEALKQQLLGL